MAEIIIGEHNWQQFLQPPQPNAQGHSGLKPRDFQTHPVGCYAFAPPFDVPLVNDADVSKMLAAQKAAHARGSDIRNKGMNGQPMPSRDQNGRGYSHTGDTEVLTEKGWVLWPDWNHTDLLGTINPLTHMLEFQAATEWHASEYVGQTYHSTNRRLDFSVTNYHRMYVRKWDEKRRTLSNHYTFQNADSLGWYVGLLPAPSGFVGTEFGRLAVEWDREYAGDDFLAMLALVTSDGWAGGSDNTRNQVSFCCFREDRHEEIHRLATRLGFSEQENRRGVWIKNSPALAVWVRANCYTGSGLKAQNKKVPDLVKCASMRQIEHFLSFFGDQDHDPTHGRRFYSASKRMVDDLQELLLRVGKRSSIGAHIPRTAVRRDGVEIRSGESWTLYEGEADRLCLDRKKHIETDSYRGLVYCATVPNGLLVTRRNGSILCSANCWAHSGVSAHLMVRAIMGEPYADLSAYMVACIIKDYRDEGGWGAEGVEFQAEKGCATSKTWPQQSASRSNDNPNMWADAALHKFTEWMDLDDSGANVRRQLITALLYGMPTVVDYNWWSHSICAIDLEDGPTQFGITRGENGKLLELPEFELVWGINSEMQGLAIRIWNSWGDSWSENGTGLLTGSKALPDGALAARVMTPSAT